MSEEEKLEFNNQLNYIKENVLQAKTTIDIVQKNIIEIFANENIYKQIVANEESDVTLADGTIVPNFAKFKKMFLEVQAPDSAKLEGSSKSEVIEEVSSMINEANKISHYNYLTNGNIEVANRGNAITITSAYTTSRFNTIDYFQYISAGSSGGAGTTLHEKVEYEGLSAYKLTNTIPATSQNMFLSQSLEYEDVKKLRGKRVTYSCYVASTLLSTGVWLLSAGYSTNENQAITSSIVSGFVGLGIKSIPQLTLNMTRYSITFDVPMEAKSLGVFLCTTSNVVQNANIITNRWKLEEGEEVTECENDSNVYDKCKRRYQKRTIFANKITAPVNIPINMRTTPTISGGGSGFVSYSTADTLVFYQDTSNLVTLELSAELV